MNIEEISFNDLRKRKSELGLVMLGAGKPLEDWTTGLSEILVEEGVISGDKPIFSSAYVVTGNNMGKDGRTDLVMFIDTTNNVKAGKLAMFRLKFEGLSWVDDFVVNYAKDYQPLKGPKNLKLDEE